MSIALTHSLPRSANYMAAAQNQPVADKTLIRRIANGDQAALRTLMERHQTRIYRFILRFVSDRNLAEDVVSDTFFAAWRQAAQFENRSSVATWLLAIARYKALSARERVGGANETLEEAAATLIDPRQRADATIEGQDSARVLRRCVSALPAEQAILIDLVYYREKSVKEAAAITGIPENTVKSRMFLARKKLAALLSVAGVDRASIGLMPNVA